MDSIPNGTTSKAAQLGWDRKGEGQREGNASCVRQCQPPKTVHYTEELPGCLFRPLFSIKNLWWGVGEKESNKTQARLQSHDSESKL